MTTATAKPPGIAMPALDKTKFAVHAADEGKAEEITILDVRAVSGVTDYFVIFTGSGTNHVRALAKRVEDALRENGVKPSSVDGARTTAWVAMDYGNVIVHAMTADSRRTYDLERLWGDAPRVDIKAS